MLDIKIYVWLHSHFFTIEDTVKPILYSDSYISDDLTNYPSNVQEWWFPKYLQLLKIYEVLYTSI